MTMNEQRLLGVPEQIANSLEKLAEAQSLIVQLIEAQRECGAPRQKRKEQA